MLKRTLLLIAALLLSGCATTVGNCDLLALKTYDQPTRDKVADEVAAAPPDAAWPQTLEDYVGLRDAVRACKGE